MSRNKKEEKNKVKTDPNSLKHVFRFWYYNFFNGSQSTLHWLEVKPSIFNHGMKQERTWEGKVKHRGWWRKGVSIDWYDAGWPRWEEANHLYISLDMWSNSYSVWNKCNQVWHRWPVWTNQKIDYSMAAKCYKFLLVEWGWDSGWWAVRTRALSHYQSTNDQQETRWFGCSVNGWSKQQ